MSDLERRDVLIGTLGLATAALAATPAAAGDASFMNNVPDPLLSGDNLPTFKFALEKSEGKVIGNSYGKEATVKQLPISKGIAGVSMRLEPGAMRELHWHATAAEWAFVAEGRDVAWGAVLQSPMSGNLRSVTSIFKGWWGAYNGPPGALRVTECWEGRSTRKPCGPAGSPEFRGYPAGDDTFALARLGPWVTQRRCRDESK
jgi:hypothetical protein